MRKILFLSSSLLLITLLLTLCKKDSLVNNGPPTVLEVNDMLSKTGKSGCRNKIKNRKVLIFAAAYSQ